MKKLRVKENRKVGYYTLVLRQLGQKDLINESFVFTTSFDSNRLSQGKIGEFAIFTADLLKNNDKAEKYFLRAIERNPKNSFWTGNYAIFLHFYKKEYDLAEEIYKKSIIINEDDAFLMFNYANLLVFGKKDYNKAEELLKKILSIEPNNPKYKCAYAGFLFKIKKKFAQAEALCKKVTDKHKNNPTWLATYAQLKILKGEPELAEPMILKAFDLNPSDELSLELWFYLYAHYKKHREEAEKQIKKLLDLGVKSLVWGLQQNVVIAIFSGHPEPQKLEEYAKLLSEN